MKCECRIEWEEIRPPALVVDHVAGGMYLKRAPTMHKCALCKAAPDLYEAAKRVVGELHSEFADCDVAGLEDLEATLAKAENR